MASIPLKELTKAHALIRRIESGTFDANDVDGVLIKLRAYAANKKVFREVADFVAHADGRNKGIACDSMTGFSDSMRYFVDYVGPRKPLDLGGPFPPYVRRLFRSQTVLADKGELRHRFRLSRQSLLQKIEKNFETDKTSGMYRLRAGKEGKDFLAALKYVTGFIHSKPAFDVSDFHAQLYQLLSDQGVPYNEGQLRGQEDQVSLALLCLISGTDFDLPDGDTARCVIATEHHYRILAGKRKTPIGEITSEPAEFGTLQINGHIQVINDGRPVTVAYPVVTTKLRPHDHCHASVFEVLTEQNEFGEFRAEFINLEPHMTLASDFKLVRAAVPTLAVHE